MVTFNCKLAITMTKIRDFTELIVYRKAFDTSMQIFHLTKELPKEEVYSLTDQVRRSSRSVCANIAEAFHKRRFPKSFVSTLNISEAEAAETKNWVEFLFACDYINEITRNQLKNQIEEIIKILITMQRSPEKWSI